MSVCVRGFAVPLPPPRSLRSLLPPSCLEPFLSQTPTNTHASWPPIITTMGGCGSGVKWMVGEGGGLEGSSHSCQAKITLISLIQLIVHEDFGGRVAYRPNEGDCSKAFPVPSLVYLQRSRGFSIAGAREPFHVFGWYATPIWKCCLPASYLLIINCCKL